MIWDKLDEDDFAEVAPKAAGASAADVVVRTFKMRNAERVRIGVSDRILAELGDPVRFALKFSKTRKLFLLQADERGGRYEPARIGKGSARKFISFAPPDGLFWREIFDEPEFYVDAATKRLAVECHPDLLRPQGLLPPPLVAPQKGVHAAAHAAAVDKARAAIPAPSFGRKG